MVNFSQTIKKIGINPLVDPPNIILDAIFREAAKTKGPIPVRGKLNGIDFIQTLVKYQGEWRLYINGEMLKASGLQVGDTAEIEIAFDPRPREVPGPPKFAKALKDDQIAEAEFHKLTPGRKKEILRYLGFLKSQEALERNIDRVLKQLRGEDRNAARFDEKRKAAEIARQRSLD